MLQCIYQNVNQAMETPPSNLSKDKKSSSSSKMIKAIRLVRNNTAGKEGSTGLETIDPKKYTSQEQGEKIKIPYPSPTNKPKSPVPRGGKAPSQVTSGSKSITDKKSKSK